LLKLLILLKVKKTKIIFTKSNIMESVLVGRRAFCVEVLSREKMEREAMMILVLVRSIYPENG